MPYVQVRVSTPLTREQIEKLAEEILDGNASAEPAVWDKDKEACTYCPYKEVCGFDLSVDGYRYRDH